MEHLVDRSVSAALFTSSSRDPLPEQARIVVIGGGIIGTSTALHLAEAGERDVLLLEANVLAGGTTWHAAGLVVGARGTGALTGLAQYGLASYAGLGERSGIDVGFQRPGSLSL
ncbi:MAG TPA: FAD-dependent oxidoreductase, partial [Naasia sp.]